MCKRSFVTLSRGKRKYQIAVEDIQEVYKMAPKKRPILPAYDCPTSDEYCKKSFI